MHRRRLVIVGLVIAAACGRSDSSRLIEPPPAPDDPALGGVSTSAAEVCYGGPCGPCAVDADCASCERCVAATCHVEPVQSLYVGHRQTCFLGDGGSRWCVGEGSGVGVAAGAPPNMPVHVDGDDGWTRLALGWHGAFGERNAQIFQWSDIDPPVLYSSDASWIDLSDDRDDFCFRHADGTAMCNGTDLGGGWSLVDAGVTHECGIKSGRILCWGSDLSNVLGQGVEADGTVVASPTLVGSDSDWAAVSISYALACALKLDGSLWCWGNAVFTGTNGVDTQGIPTQLGSDTDWLWVEVAWDHACAGKAGGKVFCWGSDDYGLLIVPGQTTVQAPTELTQTWDEFRLGGHHYCGLSGGHWYCWGWNAAGQLGIGNTLTTSVPSRPLCFPPPAN